jgi:hypothetical protein
MSKASSFWGLATTLNCSVRTLSMWEHGFLKVRDGNNGSSGIKILIIVLSKE